MTSILIVPGLGGSGDAHWQTHWEKLHPECSRIHQDNWNIPCLEDWLTNLHASIVACPQPPILVAHSLGCALVAHWAKRGNDIPVAGALLVAPSDVDSEDHTPGEVREFSPMPMKALPFPATVVASTNDPYASFQRMQVFAAAWGADFVNIGEHGHINANSFLGDWDEGLEILRNVAENSVQVNSEA